MNSKCFVFTLHVCGLLSNGFGYFSNNLYKQVHKIIIQPYNLLRQTFIIEWGAKKLKNNIYIYIYTYPHKMGQSGLTLSF